MAELEETPIPTPPPKESPFPKTDSTVDNTDISEAPSASHETPDPGALPAGVTPLKTIRVLRPTAPGSSGNPPRPGSNPLPPGPKPPSDPQIQASKSKTSRISLESAISAGAVDTSAPAATTYADMDAPPKTIRLKRPAEMPTLRVPAVLPGTPSSMPKSRYTAHIPGLPSSKKTSRLAESGVPLVSAAATSVPLTQKRTIRVKRPGSVSTATSASAESEGAVTMTAIQADEPPRLIVDTCHPFFIVAASISIIAIGVLIYVIYQQMYGANAFMY